MKFLEERMQWIRYLLAHRFSPGDSKGLSEPPLGVIPKNRASSKIQELLKVAQNTNKKNFK